jgi:hypothetical protein
MLALLHSLSSIATAQQATPIASPNAVGTSSALPPAWVELGPGGAVFARILASGDCPAIDLDGTPAPMTPRAQPTAAFPVVACEAPIPFGVTSATIGAQRLVLPHGAPKRIAVIGDTGCRLSDYDARYQACNDPSAWPFAQVVRSVAAWRPDLIVHVGDYLYRESACPAGNEGCAGSPHGDNWPAWNADYFFPVSPLLGIAPWVVMRGNHETCERNAGGWFAYLDPRAFQIECQRFTEPYLVPLVGVTLAAVDSAEAADTKDTPEEVAEYARQFEALAAIAPPDSWLITHRPLWGLLEGQDGEFEVENASFAAATRDLPLGDYSLVFSGHIHLAESLAFAGNSGRPPQIISGNSGTALDNIPTASPTAGELQDPVVEEAETVSSFGFLTLERQASGWTATPRDAEGQPLRQCIIASPEITCGPATTG